MYKKSFKRLEKRLLKELKQKGVSSRIGDMVTYRSIMHEGDLPGDQGLQYWGQEDWDKHSKLVEDLKAKGTYGKPWICELTLKDFPEFDRPQHKVISGKPMESYRMVLIDFRTGESTEIKR